MGFVGKAASGAFKGFQGGQGGYYSPESSPFYEEMVRRQEVSKHPLLIEAQRGMLRGGPGRSLADYASSMDPALLEMFLTSGVGAELGAQDILKRGAITGRLYGDEGEMVQALKDVREFGKTGYGLTPQDQTAYGQMSGELARAFGQSEQGLAQSLADRGLLGAQSGVAGQAYAGMQGNKMEQFAGLQRQIADQAMQRAMQRDQMLRTYALSLSQQASGDIGRQVQQQFQARGATEDALRAGQQAYMGNEALRQASQASKEANYAPGFGEMFGAGLAQSGYGAGKMLGEHGTGQRADKMGQQAFGAGLGMLGGMYGGSEGAKGASQGQASAGQQYDDNQYTGSPQTRFYGSRRP